MFVLDYNEYINIKDLIAVNYDYSKAQRAEQMIGQFIQNKYGVIFNCFTVGENADYDYKLNNKSIEQKLRSDDFIIDVNSLLKSTSEFYLIIAPYKGTFKIRIYNTFMLKRLYFKKFKNLKYFKIPFKFSHIWIGDIQSGYTEAFNLLNITFNKRIFDLNVELENLYIGEVDEVE